MALAFPLRRLARSVGPGLGIGPPPQHHHFHPPRHHHSQHHHPPHHHPQHHYPQHYNLHRHLHRHLHLQKHLHHHFHHHHQQQQHCHTISSHTPTLFGVSCHNNLFLLTCVQLVLAWLFGTNPGIFVGHSLSHAWPIFLVRQSRWSQGYTADFASFLKSWRCANHAPKRDCQRRWPPANA